MGPGGDPRVQAYDDAGNLLFDFFAYDSSLRGGVSVATADVTGDGIEDIITGAGAGGAPRVRTFDAATHQGIADVFAYEPSFTGGVFVACGDVFGTGAGQQVLVGPGSGGGPRLRVLDLDGSARADLFVAVDTLRNGLIVATLDRPTGESAIVIGAGEGAFRGDLGNGELTGLERVGFFESGFQGGVFVG